MKRGPNRFRLTATSVVPFILSAVLMQTSLAAAPIRVGTGTPESCTGAALQDALTTAALRDGGNIKFDCGGRAVTIAPSQHVDVPGIGPILLMLSGNTTIDGDGLITLSCGGPGGLIYVQFGATVELKNLVVADCFDENSVIFNAGTLTFKNSVLSDAGSIRAPTLSNAGTFIVKNSVFSNNIARDTFIASGATMTIENTRISDTYIGGTFLSNYGALKVKNSEFTHGYGAYGTIGIFNAGTASIKNSTFAGNRAEGSGGALRNNGAATIEGSTFSYNDVADPGGAIYNAGTLTVGDSTFTGNSTAYGDGGAIYNRGALIIKGSVITQNVATRHGGGIYISTNGSLQITSSDVSGNIPDDIFFAQ